MSPMSYQSYKVLHPFCPGKLFCFFKRMFKIIPLCETFLGNLPSTLLPKAELMPLQVAFVMSQPEGVQHSSGVGLGS